MKKSVKDKQRKILETVLDMPVSPEALAQYGFTPTDFAEPVTRAHLLVVKLVDRACNGDLSAMKEITERLYGKNSAKPGEASRSETNYYDFLMSIVEREQKEKDLPPEIEETEDAPGLDLLEDLE